MEYIDINNEKMEIIGRCSREEAHQKGLWHQTFHCWIVCRKAEKQYLIFQRRNSRTNVYPNFFDISASGHLISGEKPENGVRELEEELGFSVEYKALIPLGIRCSVSKIGTITEKEFCHTFMYEHNTPLMDYKLKYSEIGGLIRMEIAGGLKLFAHEIDQLEVDGCRVCKDGKLTPLSLTVTRNDFVPCHDPCYLKMLIMAERYFNNSKYLAV